MGKNGDASGVGLEKSGGGENSGMTGGAGLNISGGKSGNKGGGTISGGDSHGNTGS